MVGEMVRWFSKGGEEGGKGLVGQFERWVRCAAANGFGFGFEMGWDGMGWDGRECRGLRCGGMETLGVGASICIKTIKKRCCLCQRRV